RARRGRNARGREHRRALPRRPLTDDSTSEGNASRDATEHDGRYSYRYYLTPTSPATSEWVEPSLAEVARVITAGLCMEACFRRGKSEAGRGEKQGTTGDRGRLPMVHNPVRGW